MPNKAAVIQMTSSHKLENNLQQADALLRQAAKEGAGLVVLPEMWATMVMGQMDKIELAETQGAGPIQDFMQQKAKELGIWLVGGTIPIRSDNPEKVRASCLIYDDKGTLAARYDKVHLFDVTISPGKESYQESAVTEPGDEIVILDTPIGKLGVAVCYDIRFPELFRVMFKHGVELFAVPAAFTITTGLAHWQLLARARAVENLSYVLGACQWGQHDTGRSTFGGSCIIDPWGRVLHQLDKNVGVLTAEINLDQLHEIRSNMPVHEHIKIHEI